MRANTIKKLMDKKWPDNKVFTVGALRDLEKLVMAGEISYSRMVELLNIRAICWMSEHADLLLPNPTKK